MHWGSCCGGVKREGKVNSTVFSHSKAFSERGEATVRKILFLLFLFEHAAEAHDFTDFFF